MYPNIYYQIFIYIIKNIVYIAVSITDSLRTFSICKRINTKPIAEVNFSLINFIYLINKINNFKHFKDQFYGITI